MASGKKKLDEYHIKILRELVSSPSNKQCFDCHQRGPTYVNVTIGSFVCTTCSGMLRGLTPPHRVKSISMATFTPDEVDFVKARGNEYCKRIWLGLCDVEQPTKDEQQIKDFMISKYERKRYYLNPSSNTSVNITNGAGTGTPDNMAILSTTLVLSKPSSTANSRVAVPTLSHPATTLSLKPLNRNTVNNNNCKANGVQIKSVNGTIATNTNKNLNKSNSIYNMNNNSNALTSDQLLTIDLSNAMTDPFSSSNLQYNTPPVQPSFANFENNPIFSSSSTSGFTGVSEMSEDRYAALKDLDFLMKSQKQQNPTNSQTATGFEWGANGEANVGVIWPSQTQTSETANVTPNPFTSGENLWVNNNLDSFGVNPFRNNATDSLWCRGAANGHLATSFPTSQSLNFTSTKTSRNSDVINNPFTVGSGNGNGSNDATGHHSSNPFL